jgi:hypothetical protein
MLTYLLAALVFGFVVTGMALGVIFSDKPIKGSCGGIGALGLDTACEICGGNPQVCEQETRNQAGIAAGLHEEGNFYEVATSDPADPSRNSREPSERS